MAWEKDGKYLVTGSGALPGQVITQTEPAVGDVVVWDADGSAAGAIGVGEADGN